MATSSDAQPFLGHMHNNKYAYKLEFPRFGGEGVGDWIFRGTIF